MATYVPGVRSYRPNYTPYKPDFEFANTVMQVREDRYNTNHKQLSNLYGNVVYADLSREDTKQQRDDFAQRLAPTIQKISGMDLSLHQNMDAAQGVFQPFLENKLIQQDIYRTSKFKNEYQRAKSLLNAPNPDAVDQYWETGIKAMQYQMEDFVNASPEEAMSKPIPEYVPNVNLYKMALNELKESGIEAEDFYFTEDNRFMIKQKNGSLIYDASYDFALRNLSKNANVQKAYATQGLVEARSYAENGIKLGKFSSLNEGKLAWAKEITADITNKVLTLQGKKEQVLKEADETVANHEDYVKKIGEDRLIESEKEAWQKALLEKNKAEESLKSTQETVSLAVSKMSDDDQAILNKAYGLLMNWNMTDDIKAAAKTYSMMGASREAEVNQYQRDRDKHNLDMIKQANQQAFERAERIAKQDAKDAKDPKNSETYKKAIQAMLGQDYADVVKKEDGTPNPNANVVELSESAFEDGAVQLMEDEIKLILDWHQEQESLKKNGNPSIINIKGKDYTIDEAKAQLRKKENQSFLEGKFYNMQTFIKDFKQKYPNLSNQKINNLESRINKVEGLGRRIALGKQLFNETAAQNYNQLLKLSGLEGVDKFHDDVTKYSVPKIVQNEKIVTEDEFVKQFVDLAEKGKVLNRGLFRTFDNKYTKLQTTGYDEFAETSVVFDKKAATEAAKESYKDQMDALNNAFNGVYNSSDQAMAGGTSSFKAFGAYDLLRGKSIKEMNDNTGSMSNSYGTGVIVPSMVNKLPEENLEVLNNFFDQKAAGGMEYYVGDIGNKEGLPEEGNEKVKPLIEDAIRDYTNGYIGGDKKDKPIFDIVYKDAYGTKDAKDAKGAYVITFSEDQLNEAASTEGETSLIAKTEKTKYKTVTVLVDKEYDISSFAVGKFNYSDVDTDIQFNNSYKVDVTGGGSIQIYKEGGIYKVSLSKYVYDEKAKDRKRLVNNSARPILYPDDYSDKSLRKLPVKPYHIQSFADHMKNELMKIAIDLPNQINANRPAAKK